MLTKTVKGLETFTLYIEVYSLQKKYTIARAVGDKCKTSVGTRRLCVFIVLRIPPTEMQRTINKAAPEVGAYGVLKRESMQYNDTMRMCENTQVPLTQPTKEGESLSVDVDTETVIKKLNIKYPCTKSLKCVR